MKELLDKIGISYPGEFSEDGAYIVKLPGNREYSECFSKLDHSELVEENPDMSVVDPDMSTITYDAAEHYITLIADFDNDNYMLVVGEFEEESTDGE